MNFLIDEQLPARLARELRVIGHEAWHVRERLFASLADRKIWSYAISDNAVIITKDSDYMLLLREPPPHVAVFWIQIGNCSSRILVDFFVQQLASIEASLNAGEMLSEVS